MKELDIERKLTFNITKLLLVLGNEFAFEGRKYHLKIENEDYYTNKLMICNFINLLISIIRDIIIVYL